MRLPAKLVKGLQGFWKIYTERSGAFNARRTGVQSKNVWGGVAGAWKGCNEGEDFFAAARGELPVMPEIHLCFFLLRVIYF